LAGGPVLHRTATHPAAARPRAATAALALGLALLLGGCAVPQVPLPVIPTVPSVSAPRPVITRAADLPRARYPVQGSLEAVVRSPQAFAAFVAPLRRDTEALLARYDFADKAMQRDLLTLLAVIDHLEGRHREALQRLDAVQALQDKPADRWVSGLRLRAVASAALQHPPGTAAHAAAVGAFLDAALARMPADVVANEIRELKASAEISGEGLALGRVREVLQPIADANGALTGETAPGLVTARLALTRHVPLKAVFIEHFGRWLARHTVVKPDIWAARAVRLPEGAGHAPVALAVWDSGVDTALFPGRLVLDAGRPAVIGFDRFGQPAHTELAPIPADLRARLPQLAARSKGFSDLEANIDSPEASDVKQWLSTLPPSQFRAAAEEINLIGNYEHGTHVAGIAMDGNPHARLLVARIEFGHTLKPDPCPSRELSLRDVANTRATVDYFVRHGVRVVNMSWGGSVGDVESELEKCGLGATPDARKALARELFDLQREGLRQALSRAPQILFIAAAGNENQDSSVAESTPADLVLPNLLTVGAVDRAGDEASFTSYGPTVRLHANGYQVESVLPGGARVALSGTSMAAPQAANLAAKLLALRPTLTPPQLIELMLSTADTTPDGRRRLMNPTRAVAALPPSR
jgi:hypothetical protein